MRFNRKIWEVLELSFYFLAIIALLSIVGSYVLFLQAYKMPAGSMIPTLLIGDHILVKKEYYNDFRSPQRDDLVVFRYPEDESKMFIKRIIGLPGDIVEIRDKQVYINQLPLEESYAIHNDPMIYGREEQPRDNFGPFMIPQDSYFVMGDNRDHSMDSRYWGVVKLNKIIGKVFLIYWSWDKNSFSVRWERIGMALE